MEKLINIECRHNISLSIYNVKINELGDTKFCHLTLCTAYINLKNAITNHLFFLCFTKPYTFVWCLIKSNYNPWNIFISTFSILHHPLFRIYAFINIINNKISKFKPIIIFYTKNFNLIRNYVININALPKTFLCCM